MMQYKTSIAAAALAILLAWPLPSKAEPPAAGAGLMTPAEAQPKVFRPMEQRMLPGSWCRYPQRQERAEPDEDPNAVLRLIATSEVEPNNTIQTAHVLPFGTGAGQDVDINLAGTISPADVDYFRFTAQKGDVIGFAVLGVGSMDPVLHLIRGSDGETLIINDDFAFHTFYYPAAAPWPGGDQFTDSAMSFVVPENGQYFLKVEPFSSLSIGDYQLRIRSRNPYLRSLESPGQQIVFLDFDGATINVCATYGCFPPLNPPFRTLSPLASFLGGWGLTPAQESAVIDEVIAVVQENFDSMRLASLNGNLVAGGPPGSFDVTVLNSRDHIDPFGQPNVSRVIIGGTIEQFTIETIGLAQYIDPGNFAPEDTSVVLLDLLSEAPGGSPFCCSINDIPRAPGFTMVQAVGRLVGNIVSHEIGHTIGCWHTTVLNSSTNIMDEGGNLLALAGAGVDGILGTPDDVDIDFITDTFSTFEDFFGINQTEVTAAFGLSTGALQAVPPTLLNVTPTVESDLGELGQISVTFSEPVVGVVPAALRVNGITASSVSGSGGGPYLFQGFVAPGDGPVTVEMAAGQIRDGVGNAFAGGNWQYLVRDCNANRILDTDEIGSGQQTDCNFNLVPDVCEDGVLRSRAVPNATIATGQTMQLGEWLPFTGGEEPIIYEWVLRGNPGSEAATGSDPTYGPLPAGVYVIKVTATDGAGCQATGFVTVMVEGASGNSDSSGGDVSGDPPVPSSLGDVFNSACGSGSACGATGGGMVLLLTIAGSTLGARRISRRRR